MTKAKILITHKNYSIPLKSEIFTPIQTGTVLSDVIFDDMLHDNEGKNISDKNDFLCELTAVYWAWKNYDKLGNPDYIGFMHNRRHFIFNDNEWVKHPKGFVVFPKLDDDYIKQCSLNDDETIKNIKDFDCIIPNPVHIGNVYEQFKQEHDVKYYDLALSILKKKYPEYSEVADSYNASEESYVWCMGIYAKGLFKRYASWLFDILFELMPQIDFTGYTSQEARLPGYIGERLTGIFFTKLFQENIKIRKLNVSFLQDVKKIYIPKLFPYFKKDYAVLAVSSSNEYVPYLSVYLTSIAENASDNHNYDIIIFEHSISELNKQLLINKFSKKNISIRFCNPDIYLQGKNLYVSLNYFKEECYFRLVAPLALEHFSKVLFSDIDLIFNKDPWLLFSIPMQGYPIACANDYVWGALLNLNPNMKKYALETLKLERPYSYMNTGVMLMDITQFNQKNYPTQLLDLVCRNKFQFQEQDGLNSFFQNNILEINPSWNYVVPDANWDNIYKSMPLEQYKKMQQASQDPGIIHFSGPMKPWKNVKKFFYYIYMEYARKSPLYEDIILNMLNQKLMVRAEIGNNEVFVLRQELEKIHFPNINNHFDQIETEISTLYKAATQRRLNIRKIYYKVMSNICLTSVQRKKYRNKLKNIINI